MKKSRIVIAVLIALMLLSTAVQAADNFAWVRLSKGKVWVKSAESKYWFKPKIGMALKENDVIKTHKNSWITIAYENSSLVRIAPSSEVKITKVDYDRKKQSLESKIKIFGLGKIIAAVKKLGKGSSNMDVETPTAVAGVRGTEFMVDVPDKDTSIVAVFGGKVIVKDFVTEAGLSEDDMGMMMDLLHEVALGDGQYTIYKKDKGFSRSKKLEEKYKEDKKLAGKLDKEALVLAKELAKEDFEKRSKKSEEVRETAIKDQIK